MNKWKMVKVLVIATINVIIWTIAALVHELTHWYLNFVAPMREICVLGWNNFLGPAWIAFNLFEGETLNYSETLPTLFFYIINFGLTAILYYFITKPDGSFTARRRP